jgi:Tn3 transposase DDE domain-containing protein
VGGYRLEGRAAQGLIARLAPPFDRRLVETGLGQMMGDEFWLGRGDRRELAAQGIGDLPVQDLPPAPEQGFVGGVLEQELVTLYAALMGLGSDLSVAELVRMVPSLAADSLGQMMLKIEVERRLRWANDAVLRFMREHSIAGLWDAGYSPRPT